MDKEKRAYKEGKKSAIDAVITSRARHLADNKAKKSELNTEEEYKYRYIARKLSDEKVENLIKVVKNADESNDRISVDIADDKGNTKTITADFDKEDGHMSLHVIRGSHKLLDKNRKGRQKSTGYGENDRFIKDNTGKDVKQLARDKFDSEKKKVGLKESEFSDDLSAIFGDMLKKSPESIMKSESEILKSIKNRNLLEDVLMIDTDFSQLFEAAIIEKNNK